LVGYPAVQLDTLQAADLVRNHRDADLLLLAAVLDRAGPKNHARDYKVIAGAKQHWCAG
jgi:hypothetical protein